MDWLDLRRITEAKGITVLRRCFAITEVAVAERIGRLNGRLLKHYSSPVSPETKLRKKPLMPEQLVIYVHSCLVRA